MAISIRKLTKEEVARYFPTRHIGDMAEYMDALKGFSIDDVAEVELGDVTDRAMKRRLAQAGKQLGLRLQWSKQAMDGVVSFRVTGGPTAVAGKRRGGPRRVQG